MADEKQHDGPNADDGMGTVFADIPYIPAVSDFNRPTNRRQSRIVFGLVGAAVTGMLVVYLTRPTDRDDPFEVVPVLKQIIDCFFTLSK